MSYLGSQKILWNATKDDFACTVCRGGNIMKNENVGTRLSLNNIDCLESVKRFCYLGDMLNGGGVVEWTSPITVRYNKVHNGLS